MEISILNLQLLIYLVLNFGDSQNFSLEESFEGDFGLCEYFGVNMAIMNLKVEIIQFLQLQ